MEEAKLWGDLLIRIPPLCGRHPDSADGIKNIDSFEQLERRIGTTILVESDTIYHMLYNPETKSYEKHETEYFPNPFLSQQGTTNTDNYFQQFAKTFTEKEVLNDNP